MAMTIISIINECPLKPQPVLHCVHALLRASQKSIRYSSETVGYSLDNAIHDEAFNMTAD